MRSSSDLGPGLRESSYSSCARSHARRVGSGRKPYPNPAVQTNPLLKDKTCKIEEERADASNGVGGARGADSSARTAARTFGLFVAEMTVEPVHWRKHGPSAGHKRNHAMLDLGPDRVVAFQLNGSKGTQGTIDEARRRGIPVEVHTA